MHDFIIDDYNGFWDIICYVPHVHMKIHTKEDVFTYVPNSEKEYIESDRKKIKKNYKTKKLLVCGIGLDGYNRILAF